MQCLNVKLTYDCSNECSYCFSKNMKNIKIDIQKLKKTILEAYKNNCRGLIISGGEPTLYKENLKEIIEFSYQIGYQKYILQTNGYGFSEDRELLEFIDKFSYKVDMAISFSVIGPTSKEHDKVTQTNGSYEKLMKSIENISKTNCTIYTNTVISTLNYNKLEDIINLILPFNPEVMQFSIMHTESDNPLSLGLYKSVEAIGKIKGKISKNILRTEGVPYCLMKGYEICVGESYWPSRLDLCNHNDDYKADFSQLECGMRWKNSMCCQCIFDDICHGVWYEQKKEFMDLNILPIK